MCKPVKTQLDSTTLELWLIAGSNPISGESKTYDGKHFRHLPG